MQNAKKTLALLSDELSSVALEAVNPRIADFFGFANELANYRSGVQGYAWICAEAEKHQVRGFMGLDAYADTPEAEKVRAKKAAEKEFMDTARRGLENKIAAVKIELEAQMSDKEIFDFAESRVPS